MIRIYTVEKAKETILKRTALEKYAPATLERTAALFGEGVTPPQAVAQIINTIEAEGDTALRKWSTLLDRLDSTDFATPEAELERAYDQIHEEVRSVIQRSARRIRSFHEKQPFTSWLTEDMGGQLGQRFTPIERVGVYVPGGTAPLPSSLLMSVIPAQVAGVQRVIVTTPPNPHASILAAAYFCGVTEVFQIGGAQAIAALAFGTQSIPKVDKIVGAGNLFVTLAKQQLYGVVGLDGLAGPTETMVIADDTADPQWVAADLLAQAEHDVQASAILLTPDESLADAVRQAVTEQIERLSRKEIIAISLENKGGIVITASLEEAANLANAYAAEHLCLSVADPQGLMEQINNAGGFFLGDHSFEVLGDYVAGPSHIMPTGGTARFASPLNVLDFVKISSVIALDTETSAKLSPIAAAFAETEQLTAHAAAAKARIEEA
ncbi:MAG: histidinol dehydrogenase [Anaerolineales bacterium]|nr:histidinol dehydrogenase [Anaerolineales bacterium]